MTDHETQGLKNIVKKVGSGPISDEADRKKRRTMTVMMETELLKNRRSKRSSGISPLERDRSLTNPLPSPGESPKQRHSVALDLKSVAHKSDKPPRRLTRVFSAKSLSKSSQIVGKLQEQIDINEQQNKESEAMKFQLNLSMLEVQELQTKVERLKKGRGGKKGEKGQESLIASLRAEIAELKKANKLLAEENDRLKQQQEQ